MYEKQLRELCLLSLEKRGLGGNLTATLSYLKGVLKDRGRLFSGVCSKKMRGNRYITVKEIPTGHRKENFHHEGSQTQKLTARGGVGGEEASGLGSCCCVLALKIDYLTLFHEMLYTPFILTREADEIEHTLS